MMLFDGCTCVTQASVRALCMALQEPHPVSDKMLHHVAVWILLSHRSEAAGGTERICSRVKTTRYLIEYSIISFLMGVFR